MSVHKPSPWQPKPRRYCSEECKAADEKRLAEAEKAFGQRKAGRPAPEMATPKVKD
jgi:hypothetical protein